MKAFSIIILIILIPVLSYCQCTVSVSALTPGSCTTPNSFYSVSGTLTVSNPPATGGLIVTDSGGNSVTIPGPFGASVPFTITGNLSDGIQHTVSATFVDDPACTGSDIYIAPVACPCVPICFQTTVVKNN